MIGILKQIFHFSGRQKPLLYRALVFSVLYAFFYAMQFIALYEAVKALYKENNMPVATIVGIMIISIIGEILTRYVYQMDETKTGYRMVADHRISLGDHLRKVPMGYFSKNNIGKITGIVTTTLGDVEMTASGVLVMVIGGFINTIILVIFMIIFNLHIGLWAVFGVILYMAVTEYAIYETKKESSERQNAQNSLSSSILEYIQGMGVVRAFSLEKNTNANVRKAINKSCDKNIKLVRKSISVESLQQIVIRIFDIIILISSVKQFINGKISAPYAILFVVMSLIIFSNLETAGSSSFSMQMLASSIDITEKAYNTPVMQDGIITKMPKNEDIYIKNISFSYDSRKVINNISLNIPQKTMTAIVGPSGGGKTTICSLIARFWDVDKGEILIGGKNIKEYTNETLMNQISMVFQNVYLFNDTIENNIKFGNPNASHEEVVQAAKKACADEFISNLPEGYNTIIGEGGGILSGGEKQRISIARAIMKDAPIIILDEATSSVDPENEDKLQKAIESLTRDKTVIMIAHRLKTVRNADQIAVLADGKIVQKGTHEDLISKDGIYRDLITARRKAESWKLE